MSEKAKGLDKVLASLDKTYGKGSVGRVKDLEQIQCERQTSSSMWLDHELGGGLPRGKIIEIYGPESSGKTTLCVQAMIEEQMKGNNVALIDAEHAFDSKYAVGLGLDVDEMILSQPDNGEQALEVTQALIESGEVSMIVIDSVAALTPKAEMDGEMGDSKMGLHARLMSQACRKLAGPASHHKCTIIFINQLRMKIGVMFGNPETTTGGNALKFYASVRLDVRASTSIKDDDGRVIGRMTKVKVVKNKVGRPYGVVELTMINGEGFAKVYEVVKLGVELEIIEKSGSWYSYQGTKLGQGEKNVVVTLRDNPELMDEISDLIVKSFNNVEA